MAQANFIAMQPAQLQQLANMMRGPSSKLRRMTNATPDAWLEYKRHFLKIAALQDWDDERQRQELAAGVQEKAGNAVSDIDIAAAGATIDIVIDQYQGRFMPAAAGATARINYQTAKQLPTETVREWHTRVRELFFLAYPDGVINNQHHSMDIFINGLYIPAIHFQVASQDIDNFTGCLPVAERAETANRKTKSSGIHAMNMRPAANTAQTSSPLAPPGSGNCYFCADTFKVQNPHLKNQCPYYKTANRLFQSHRKSGKPANSNRPNTNKRTYQQRQINSINEGDNADNLTVDSDDDDDETQGN